MSTFKTKVDSATLDDFFNNHPQADKLSIETIADGEGSQAYYIKVADTPKVIRIHSRTKEGFEKDKLAYEHFSANDIPIPKIEEIGQLSGGAYYAISERSPGRTLDKLNPDEFTYTMPSILRTLDAIHQMPPIGEGYGFIQLDGTGKYSSWHEALNYHQQDEGETEKLAACSFFDQDIYTRLRTQIKEYYKYCPVDIRQLIQRDYGFDNTLAENGIITGVIDWQEAQYGDPMYDIAWLDFWSPLFNRPTDIISTIKQFYVDKKRLPEHFNDRLICYKVIIAANSMSFFAKSDQEDKYIWARDEIVKLDTVYLAQSNG
jgi:hygromycin-B 4-O-kinase